MEIGMPVVTNKKGVAMRSGRVVCLSRTDSQCIVEYDDNGKTSGWSPMSDFTEKKEKKKEEKKDETANQVA